MWPIMEYHLGMPHIIMMGRKDCTAHSQIPHVQARQATYVFTSGYYQVKFTLTA